MRQLCGQFSASDFQEENHLNEQWLARKMHFEWIWVKSFSVRPQIENSEFHYFKGGYASHNRSCCWGKTKAISFVSATRLSVLFRGKCDKIWLLMVNVRVQYSYLLGLWHHYYPTIAARWQISKTSLFYRSFGYFSLIIIRSLVCMWRFVRECRERKSNNALKIFFLRKLENLPSCHQFHASAASFMALKNYVSELRIFWRQPRRLYFRWW